MKFNEMNSYERVMSGLRGQEIDRRGAVSFTSIATIEGMKLAKASYPKAHISARKIADLATIGHDYIGFDTVMPYYSVLLEAAALGAEIDWGDELTSAYVKKVPFKKIEDIEIPPDYMSKLEIQQLLKAITLLKNRYHNEVAIIGKVMGPWTLAYHLYGVEKLVLDTILKPRETKQVIEYLSQVSVEFAEAQFEAGAHAITWAEHVTRDLVSTKLYEEFVYPIHCRVSKKLQKTGPLILHVCGNVEDRFKLFKETGFSAFHMDSRNNIEIIKKESEGKIQLVGGINNPTTLMRGGPYQIMQEVNQYIKYNLKMIGPECAIQTNVPMKNLVQLVKAVHQKI